MYNKDYHLEYQRRRYERRIEESFAKLGGVCTVCGSDQNLEFHHLNPETKLFAVTQKIATCSQAVLEAELAKCMLLCKGCHQQESDQQQSVEHGGGLTGKKNCRCPLCRPLKNEYARQRRLRSSVDRARSS